MSDADAAQWGWSGGSPNRSGTGTGGKREPVAMRESTARALRDIDLCASIEEFAKLCAGSESRDDPGPQVHDTGAGAR